MPLDACCGCIVFEAEFVPSALRGGILNLVLGALEPEFPVAVVRTHAVRSLCQWKKPGVYVYICMLSVRTIAS